MIYLTFNIKSSKIIKEKYMYWVINVFFQLFKVGKDSYFMILGKHDLENCG